MNKQELEASLPWTEGNGWPRVDCGEGWFALIARLNRELTELDPDYRVSQVKEKFGGLRYYLGSGDYQVLDPVIREAEEEAARTCEVCGAPGAVTGARWQSVLCAADR